MLLKPHGRCDLQHRAYHLVGSRSAIVAASKDGQVSIFDSEFSLRQTCRISKNPRAVAPHPTEQLLAWVNGDGGSLVVQNFAGDRIAEFSGPLLRQDASEWLKQGFIDCYFDDSGDFLWAAGPVSDDEIELQLIDVSTFSQAQKSIIADPFGTSSCLLRDAGDTALVTLWIAAGQDGQQVIWVRRHGDKFTHKLAEELVNTTPPVFSPDGSTFLVLNQDNAICKYEFSTMTPIGASLKSADESNPFAESMCFLDDRRVLASTGEGQILLLDVKQMRIVDEVVLEGHEPRLLGEYYPSLTNEQRFGTDIHWFTRLGKAIIFVYQRERERGIGADGWKDSLLWISADDLRH
jgi:WD40 repeat protein